ncbi:MULTISPECIES: TIGR03435 family protein [Acidobacteriaceae]|uniref:TIGR03435 family protein n=1 Tax=Acidobacteriaceae TaxID=204434 RepID=UPI00131CB0B6|nr:MULTISPECIES: TIGR03435 family protein [Acidobacteriaceae]MDW5265815.1 TIGR03435 family protein [Edaphobacter sp.]
MEPLSTVLRIRNMRAAWSRSLLSVTAMLVAAAMPLGVLAQSPAVQETAVGADATPLAFTVASVRRNVSGTGSCDPEHLYITADGFRMTNCPLIAALFMAYVPADGSAFGFSTDGRTVGAPDWMKSERYDIDARIESADMSAWQNPATQKEMLHRMMQSLLAERCKLAVHREMRDKSVYALVVGKNGPKFREAKTVAPAEILAKHPNVGPIPGGGMFATGAGGSMELYGVPLKTLAIVLSNKAGRPVVDKTGLTGVYDIKLETTQAELPAGDDTQNSAPSIFTIVQEQLGLRLESAKDSVETLVIDHVERPAENE